MQTQQVSELGRELVEQDDFSTTTFVQHFDFDAVAESSGFVDLHGADVFDGDLIVDVVVCQLHADINDSDVIAHGTIVDIGVLNCRRSSRRFARRIVQTPNGDFTGKANITHACRVESVNDLHSAPLVVLNGAALGDKSLDFFRIQRSEFTFLSQGWLLA